MQWIGDLSHIALGEQAPCTVNLESGPLDEWLEASSSRDARQFTFTLFGSGSFGGVSDETCELEIASEYKEGDIGEHGWRALDWSLSSTYGRSRKLACLIRPFEGQLQILLPAEESSFAPRPLLPLARTVHRSGVLLCLNREERLPPKPSTGEDPYFRVPMRT